MYIMLYNTSPHMQHALECMWRGKPRQSALSAQTTKGAHCTPGKPMQPNVETKKSI